MKDSVRKAMWANMKKSSKPITAYDVQAKRKVKMQDPKIITMKNHMLAWEGRSPVSGNKVFRIIGKNC